ncbi:hypothetical protein GIB67_020292 [Kingdonia uniflora]|uniref:Uncharacterized protein n=1 Tax=Kingdonia uniflora TaxID=39325 RepID=A0A7J7P449_9MAGN|nr:hypothetical protein GIB67_020292 [Kingdonia uniflora]
MPRLRICGLPKANRTFVSDKPILGSSELSSEEGEEEVERLRAQLRHKQRQQEVALENATEAVERTKVELAKEQDVGAQLSEELQRKKADLVNGLRKIEELREIIRNKEVEFTGSSRQMDQPGDELKYVQVRVTELLAELEEEAKSVKDLQFHVNVLEVDMVDMRARARKYEVLWLAANVMMKEVEEFHDQQNEQMKKSWNKIYVLKVTLDLEHKMLNKHYREDKVEWSMFLVGQMDNFITMLEGRDADVRYEIRLVKESCAHLKVTLKEVQSKLNDLVFYKQVKSESDIAHERKMTVVISSFASEFKKLEVESRLVYDRVVAKSLQCKMEEIRSEYLAPMVDKIGAPKRSMVREGNEIMLGRMPDFMLERLNWGQFHDNVGPSNLGKGGKGLLVGKTTAANKDKMKAVTKSLRTGSKQLEQIPEHFDGPFKSLGTSLIRADLQSLETLVNVGSKEPGWWVWVTDENVPSSIEEWSGIDNDGYLFVSEEHACTLDNHLGLATPLDLSSPLYPFRLRSFPMIYFGAPISYGKVTIAKSNKLLGKVQSKVEGWKGKLLSNRGTKCI